MNARPEMLSYDAVRDLDGCSSWLFPSCRQTGHLRHNSDPDGRGMAVHLQYRFGLKSNQAYAPEKPLKTGIGAVSVENWIDA
jgi:hypothetical protein